MTYTNEDMVAARQLLDGIDELVPITSNQKDILLPGVASIMHARWKAGCNNVRQYGIELFSNMNVE